MEHVVVLSFDTSVVDLSCRLHAEERDLVVVLLSLMVQPLQQHMPKLL